MAREMLYEESALSQKARSEEKLYKTFLAVAILFFVIFGITASVAIGVIPAVLSNEDASRFGKIWMVVRWGFFLLFSLGGGFLFWHLKNRFNVSYDYSFVEDELRVTKVFNGRKRKFLFKVRADQILKIGWCEKASYENTLRGLTAKPKILSPNKIAADDKDFIYLLVAHELGKRVYVLECRKELLEYLVLAAGRNKLERE